MYKRKIVFSITFLCFARFLKDCAACLGASSCFSGGCAPPFAQYAGAATATRNRALAAPKHVDTMQRVEQCTPIGVYRASELRSQVSIYNFPQNKAAKTVENGGSLSCNFDADDEPCAWYGIVSNASRNVHLEIPQLTASTTVLGALPSNTINEYGDFGDKNNDASSLPFSKIAFNRARFEKVFDLVKFDCTNDRTFSFENYFLLAGGQSDSENSIGIEARIPCQEHKALLRFNYWTNNDTPVLKICLFLKEIFSPQCEEAKLEANPLSFEIPPSLTPFRLRIQVENVGLEDIVLIDSIEYQGTICQHNSNTVPHNLSLSATVSEDGASINAIRRNPAIDDYSNPIFSNHLPHIENRDFVGIGIHDSKKFEKTSKSLFSNTKVYPVYPQESSPISSKIHSLIADSTALPICEALPCNFTLNNACGYKLAGLGSTSPWRLSNLAVGNPHTGIHRSNPNDKEQAGFTYAAGKDNSFQDIFVLESPLFTVKKPTALLFDVFQRSMGPKLSACIDGFVNCPYSNPPLRIGRHWHLNQRVLLEPGSTKVYFIATNLTQNQFIGMDNIRIIKLTDDCL